jgi:hypothetical protein
VLDLVPCHPRSRQAYLKYFSSLECLSRPNRFSVRQRSWLPGVSFYTSPTSGVPTVCFYCPFLSASLIRSISADERRRDRSPWLGGRHCFAFRLTYICSHVLRWTFDVGLFADRPTWVKPDHCFLPCSASRARASRSFRRTAPPWTFRWRGLTCRRL